MGRPWLPAALPFFKIPWQLTFAECGTRLKAVAVMLFAIISSVECAFVSVFMEWRSKSPGRVVTARIHMHKGGIETNATVEQSCCSQGEQRIRPSSGGALSPFKICGIKLHMVAA